MHFEQRTEPHHRPQDRPRSRPQIEIEIDLFLARHGQGSCNAAGVIGGDRGCTGLSPWGQEQSHRVAQRLAGTHAARPFDLLACSPRLRVRQTAEIIGHRLGLPVTTVDALRGQEFGQADGRGWQAVTTAFGGPPTHAPDRAIAPGAETWAVYAERVLAALDLLLAGADGHRVLLVAHGKTIALACTLLQGAADPAVGVERYGGDHGGLTHWQRRSDPAGPASWRLLVHNDLTHLVAARDQSARLTGA
jgi:probable phosphoglycerate mutase